MNHWIPLESKNQLDAIVLRSQEKPCLIFKHSTTCPISIMAKSRLEKPRITTPKEPEIYYLDLLKHRDISNEIAEKFGVHHESPQVLLIEKGECIYDASHLDISIAEVLEQV